MYDRDAQPPPGLNRARREARDASELLGVIRGVLADGQVVDREIEFLGRWLLTNQEFAAAWPFDCLVHRIGDVLRDGRIDESERASLHEIMQEIVGHPSPDYFVNTPATLPLTKPAPNIIFPGNEFVLTGKFAFGPRKLCESEMRSRGATCCGYVTKRTNYLVIGGMSSRDWLYSTHGRKIEDAIENVECGLPTAIVSEQHWVGSIRLEP